MDKFLRTMIGDEGYALRSINRHGHFGEQPTPGKYKLLNVRTTKELENGLR